MDAKSAAERVAPQLTTEQFTHLGDGAVAYVRPMLSDDFQRAYPHAPRIAPGQTVFALISAAGAPIVIADTKEGALANAWENKLQTVSLH